MFLPVWTDPFPPVNICMSRQMSVLAGDTCGTDAVMMTDRLPHPVMLWSVSPQSPPRCDQTNTRTGHN